MKVFKLFLALLLGFGVIRQLPETIKHLLLLFTDFNSWSLAQVVVSGLFIWFIILLLKNSFEYSTTKITNSEYKQSYSSITEVKDLNKTDLIISSPNVNNTLSTLWIGTLIYLGATCFVIIVGLKLESFQNPLIQNIDKKVIFDTVFKILFFSYFLSLFIILKINFKLKLNNAIENISRTSLFKWLLYIIPCLLFYLFVTYSVFLIHSLLFQDSI